MASRFNIDALREFFGDKVFARGETYLRDGLVAIIDADSKRIRAQVSGGEEYRTVVTGKGADIGGECSCPAFEDYGPCKHMAATALAANAGAGAAAEGTLTRIRTHLSKKDAAALVDLIVDLADHDPALLQRLELEAVAEHGDGTTIEPRLKKALDAATRTGRFIDYHAAPDWARGVDAALDALAAVTTGPCAEASMRLALHAVSRIEKAIDNMDDSDGHCSQLLARAADIHLAACRSAKPDGAVLARDLFEREMMEEYDAFIGAVATYADVLGKKGLKEYRRLAESEFNALAPRAKRDSFDSRRARLSRMMDFFAEQDGDLEARIAIREADQASQWDVLRLAEFCLEHGRADEALRRAEEGLWLFDDARPDERLVTFLARLLAKGKRANEAVAHLMHAFEKAPSLALYRELRSIGKKAAGDAAIETLRVLINTRSSHAREVRADLLIEIFLEEKLHHEAWAIVRDRGAREGLQERLARASEASHPAEALAVYRSRVEALVRAGGNQGYAGAAALVARMERLEGVKAHGAYVADLRARHKAKRNFMKALG